MKTSTRKRLLITAGTAAGLTIIATAYLGWLAWENRPPDLAGIGLR